MKALASLLALCLVAYLAPAAHGAAKALLKTGGNFEVEVVKDIAYYEGNDADAVKHKLDLYLPKGQKDFPVLLFVHGGSWRSGDKQLYGALGSVFAKNGVGMAISNYRLSPKVQHPEHIKDVARAFAWTHKNISKYGGKADQVFVSGHSAGAHLVSLLAADESYLKAEQLTAGDIRGVLALSGVYMIVPNRLFEAAFGKDGDIVTNASPFKHVKEKLPPFLLLYAEKDYPTLDMMAEQMGHALQKNKCEACVMKMPERDHISIIRKAAGSEDDPTIQAMLEFLAKHSSLKLTAKDSK